MLKYIIRRTFYSVWVIFGVLLLTFALFNLASGDPAAAVLGKNAEPAEVDSLRRELGSDLPLFFGRDCTTAAFAGAEAENLDGRSFPRLLDVKSIRAEVVRKDGTSEIIPVADDAKIFTVEKVPGNPAEKVTFIRRQESPWNSQFFRALGELVSFKKDAPYISFFNFGNTLMSREPVTDVLKRGIGPSLALMLPIFAGEIIAGIVLALAAVAFAGRFPDRMLMLAAVFTMSMSYLVTIIFGQWFFGYYLNLFPVWGFGKISNFILPVIIGIISGIGSNLRFFRTVFIDELRKEYLRTALAKGAAPASVYGYHLLKNAMVQIITRIGAGLPFLFTGSLLLESFFGIPGLGFAGMEALYDSDIQMLKALVMMSALLFVAMNLITDIAYAWADPRIKLK
ncbi:MAG: ABC transporter permease [Lentisphaeria bacterium]|nr:ABC transporter permease [Lentisphaeria bacterium]